MKEYALGLGKLKKNLLAAELAAELEEDLDDFQSKEQPTQVEVLADSLRQALDLAAHELRAKLSQLDYEILEKGASGIMGVGRLPYRVLVRIMEDIDSKYDIEDLNTSLIDNDPGTLASGSEVAIDQDGKASVRIFRSGVFLTVFEPKGAGKPIDFHATLDRVKKAGVLKFNEKLIKKAVEAKSNEPLKIGDWIPKPDADSTLAIEIAPDEMSATINISSPRPGGRHLQLKEILKALKGQGVVFGYQDQEIQSALDSDVYYQPVVAARGEQSVKGEDGYIDYKVRIEKKIQFKEDDAGRVNFLEKDLIENVVQGQILAELIPEKKGKPGKTVTNRILPFTNGNPTQLKPGKGTMLSEDGHQLLAERNGQAVFTQGKLNVEETYTIGGDVGLNTGNIIFLGSVFVRGSVTDNMQVKAAGNIEIGGSVQKSHLEAEGDIIIRQGIQGRGVGIIESTTGSLYAKFIQSANISVGKDVVVSEGILHSKVSAGGRFICNGLRAQIFGGEIMAGEEVRVKQLGSQAHTQTKVVVGTNPKILQQINQLNTIQDQANEKLEKIEQSIKTLEKKKSMGASLTDDKEEMLVKILSFQEKLQEKVIEAENEKEQLNEYVKTLATNGKVHIEKTLYPGVTIEINNAIFVAKDEYKGITLIEEKGNIKIVPYEQPEEDKKDLRKYRKY